MYYVRQPGTLYFRSSERIAHGAPDGLPAYSNTRMFMN
uniref:Uncharacterized protein n=1 Tax=Escherichia coli TaxID=562 RepID=A0A1L5JR81_ECOLX|nr:hypothetical protein ATO45_1P0035 [Escherichia coli]QIS37071.1 hypothetical protein [Escherichia coli]WBW58908.1 hypothetical protein [Escherichia coli]